MEKSVIVPNNKPGEDPSLARYYRPVSLLPVLRKLEDNIFLTRHQNFPITFVNNLASGPDTVLHTN